MRIGTPMPAFDVWDIVKVPFPYMDDRCGSIAPPPPRP